MVNTVFLSFVTNRKYEMTVTFKRRKNLQNLNNDKYITYFTVVTSESSESTITVMAGSIFYAGCSMLT